VRGGRGNGSTCRDRRHHPQSDLRRPATLEVILGAGTRGVRSYPLRDERGTTLGVLSFHYTRPDAVEGDQFWRPDTPHRPWPV
jgi:hypothetical protein